MGLRVKEDGGSEGRPVTGRIGVEPPGDITPRESGPTSIWSLVTRALGEPTQEGKQMTADTAAAGHTAHIRLLVRPSHAAGGWHAIDWPTAHQNVRRLQARIVKATQEGRWGKVKALQHLLTHSFSGKAIAVKRVTENQGKHTPGVDREIWDTPEKKMEAVLDLRQRGYRPSRCVGCTSRRATARCAPSASRRCGTGPCRPSTCSPWTPSPRRPPTRTPTGSGRNDPPPMR